MELCLVHNDPTQTLLITPEGTPLYGIQTPRDSAAATTTVRRLEHEAGSGLVSTEVGRIDFCGSSGTKLLLCNTNHELTLGPYDEVAQVENSWTFTGPDNRPYKWQIFIQSPVLILNDNSLTPIARYRRAKLGIVSRSRKAFLEIFPAGINILDFIVVTFVSFMKQRVTIGHGSTSADTT